MPAKIDIHTHILPPELPRWAQQFGYGGFIQLEHHAPCRARMVRDDGTFFREIESNCWDADVRAQDCNRHCVGLQVLSTVPVMFNYQTKPQHGLDIACFLNDHIAQTVARSPTQFAGLGTLPMQAPDLAVRELYRLKNDLGLAGVQIGSHVNAQNLNDPALFAVFEAAEALGAAVFVHPWDMMGQARMPDYWLPWLVGMPAEVSLAICSMIFGGVFERLPRLRVAFAHGGGSFPITFGRITHGHATRPDLCGVDNPKPPAAYLGRFWVDSLVHDAAALRYIIKLFGEDRVALGTDYPFPLGEEQPGALIEACDLPQSVRDKLLTINARHWLGLPKETL